MQIVKLVEQFSRKSLSITFRRKNKENEIQVGIERDGSVLFTNTINEKAFAWSVFLRDYRRYRDHYFEEL